MQSLIAPELTPTHARSAALVERLSARFIGTRISQIFPAGQSAVGTTKYKLIQLSMNSQIMTHEKYLTVIYT